MRYQCHIRNFVIKLDFAFDVCVLWLELHVSLVDQLAYRERYFNIDNVRKRRIAVIPIISALEVHFLTNVHASG